MSLVRSAPWVLAVVGLLAGAGAWLWTAKREAEPRWAAERVVCWAVAVGTEPPDPLWSLPRRIRRCLDGGVMVLVKPHWTPALAHAAPNLSDRTLLPDPFYVDETEVTQGRFDAFVRATGRFTSAGQDNQVAVMRPSSTGLEWMRIQDYAAWKARAYAGIDEARLPARQITHAEAAAYAEWVGCWLPSESEFAYLLACDAGEGPYPWGAELLPGEATVNCADASFARAFPKAGMEPLAEYDDGFAVCAPVASLRPNSLGLYDISGNVSEFCRDLVGPPPENGGRLGEHDYAVSRGGKWLGHPGDTLRVDYRQVSYKIGYSEAIGFRCVRYVDRTALQFIGEQPAR